MNFLKTNRKIIIPVVIVLVLAAVFFAARNAGEEQSQFQTVVVERGELLATVGATGTVRARQTAILVWSSGGTVGEVTASIGDTVAAETMLASLAPATVSQSVILAQADLVSAQKALDDLRHSDTARVQAQIALREAQEVYDRAKEYRDSLDTGLVIRVFGQVRKVEADEETIARADESLALAAARLEDAQRAYDRVKDGPNLEDIAAAQARVDAAEATWNMSRLIAPFAGTITDAHPLVGDPVNAGTPGFRLDDLSALFVDLEVSEVDINSIRMGQPVMLSFDAILGAEYHGEVSQVSQAAAPAQGVVNFTVTVRLTDADERVKPGMTAAVTITVQEISDQILIPNRSVRLVNGTRVVYVLRDGAPVKIEVRLGQSSDTMSVLADGDVNVGDQIILNPPLEFEPGPGGGGPFGG
ncbi:MAG: Macrolide export protein MacA [Anaerolineales bacterium]|nr:Macrolide export protein MacA [Anaerolineales bacterium]